MLNELKMLANQRDAPYQGLGFDHQPRDFLAAY